MIGDDDNKKNGADRKADEVGYGKPPKRTRFRPGQSGNPKGRPKGRKNLRTDVLAMLHTPVQIREGGRMRSVTTQRAALLRVREMALNGDLKALRIILQLGTEHNADSLKEDVDTALPEDDQAIVANFMARHQRNGPPDTEDGKGECTPDPEKTPEQDDD